MYISNNVKNCNVLSNHLLRTLRLSVKARVQTVNGALFARLKAVDAQKAKRKDRVSGVQLSSHPRTVCLIDPQGVIKGRHELLAN